MHQLFFPFNPTNHSSQFTVHKNHNSGAGVLLRHNNDMKSGNKINQIVRLKQVVNRWRRRIPSGGSLAVYVGAEHRRFVIPTRFLNLPVFVSLLNKAEEEFGFQSSGGLVLPCDVDFFTKLLNALHRDERAFGALDLDDFSARFSDSAVDSYSCCKSTVSDCHSFTPLLQKTKV